MYRHILASLLVATSFASISTRANADDNTTSASSTASTRYVWGNSLFLRAQPDGKSETLAKIPYGAAVNLIEDGNAPVAHSEVFAKSVTDGKTISGTLDGAWRKAHWQDKDGWIFDGYLSRYPTPNDDALKAEQTASGSYQSVDWFYARHLFGSGAKTKWSNGDSRKTAAYQAACQYAKSIHTDCTPPKDGTWIWERQEAGQGAYFIYYDAGDGPGESVTSFDKLPITFNEGVLWAVHFDKLAKHNMKDDTPVVVADFKPGKRLLLDEGSQDASMAVTVDCADKTCDIEWTTYAD